MTLDTARWYARFGWIDARGWPVRVRRADPALEWLDAHREVKVITGDYWDVYRLAFLTGGRLLGLPLPVYHDRFPEWSSARGGGRPEVEIVRPRKVGYATSLWALPPGSRVLYQARGITIVSLPGP
jgi:hypothetical protein